MKSENHKPRRFNISSSSTSVSVPIHVWTLQTISTDGIEQEIDFTKLTYANLPARKKFLGTINVQEGVRATADWFTCQTGSLQLIELSCDEPGSYVDFWMDTEEPKMGVLYCFAPEGSVTDYHAAFFVSETSSDILQGEEPPRIDD